LNSDVTRAIDPEVSLVMASYNHERFIRAAIDSCLNQTFKNVEVIVVNDGSTDGTEAEIAKIEDPRLRYFRQENRGPSVALNRAIREARGKYIALMSGDDLSLPQRVERQLAEYRRRGRGVLFSFVSFVGDDDETLATPPQMQGLFNCENTSPAETLRRLFFDGNFLNAVTMFTEKSLLMEPHGDVEVPFHPLLIMLQDHELWVRLAKKYPFFILPEVLTRYRVRTENGNLSAPSPRNQRRLHTEYHLIADSFFEGFSDRLFRETFGEKYHRQALPAEIGREFETAFLLLESRHRFSKLAGVQKLFRLLSQPSTAELARQHYGLGEIEFGKILLGADLLKTTPADYTTLYVDTGVGFTEKNSSKRDCDLDEKTFDVRFDISGFSTIKQLRWDPVEGSLCRVKITEVTGVEPNGRILPVALRSLHANGSATDAGTLFAHGDPSFIIPIATPLQSLRIRGEWERLEVADLDRQFRLVPRPLLDRFSSRHSGGNLLQKGLRRVLRFLPVKIE